MQTNRHTRPPADSYSDAKLMSVGWTGGTGQACACKNHKTNITTYHNGSGHVRALDASLVVVHHFTRCIAADHVHGAESVALQQADQQRGHLVAVAQPTAQQRVRRDETYRLEIGDWNIESWFTIWNNIFTIFIICIMGLN